jgi:hypothetical protein
MRRARIIATLLALLVALLAATLPAQAATPRCHDSAAFRVVERARDDGPGTDFLVQPMPPGAARAACRYRRAPGDFDIPGRDAESFAALVGALLVIDNGTGPEGRRLIVWNVQRRAQVLDTPLGAIVSVNSQHIVYWRPEARPADDANCPQRRRWRAELLGARMQRKVDLDLASLALQPLEDWRCVPRQ